MLGQKPFKKNHLFNNTKIKTKLKIKGLLKNKKTAIF